VTFSGDFQAVPEPASAALAAVGLVALAAARRRARP
jgi:MYXO-CTERM domain-containing protein